MPRRYDPEYAEMLRQKNLADRGVIPHPEEVLGRFFGSLPEGELVKRSMVIRRKLIQAGAY